MSTPNSKPRRANAPFNDPQADVILRTSDHVDFYVHKIVLSFASPMFKDMFTLSQTTRTQPNRNPPIIPVAENSETWDCLLRLCYPISNPLLPTMEIINGILSAATKYDMGHPIEVLSMELRRFVKTHPLRVFAIACRWKLEDVAKEAARATREDTRPLRTPSGLSVPFGETTEGSCYVPEMKDISAGSYYRLLSYLRDGNETSYCRPNDSSSGEASTTEVSLLSTTPNLRRMLSGADLVAQSLEGRSFYAHRSMLSFASPVIKEMIDKGCSPPSEGTYNLPSFCLPESSTTLSLILTLCSPMGSLEFEDADFQLVRRAIDVAIRYNIENGPRFSTHMLQKHAFTSPFPVFCTAIRYRWDAEARLAAIELTRRSEADTYTPELEDIDAVYYHALLKFQHEYKEAVCNLTDPSTAIQHWDDAMPLFRGKKNAHPKTISPEAVFASVITNDQGRIDGGVIRRIEYCGRLEEFLRSSLAEVRHAMLLGFPLVHWDRFR